MTISKDFLQKKIIEYENIRNGIFSEETRQYYNGRIDELNECLTELTKPPVKKVKEIDTDKTFENIVRFYMNKGYTKKNANNIAMEVIKKQKQKVLQ